MLWKSQAEKQQKGACNGKKTILQRIPLFKQALMKIPVGDRNYIHESMCAYQMLSSGLNQFVLQNLS